MKELLLALILVLLLAASCNSDDDMPQIPVVADFTASPLTIEVGNSIDYTDLSTGDPSSWSWTFTGGTPSTSTEQNPSVQYDEVGTFQVSLTAMNDDGEDTETKEAFITVNQPPVSTGLFDETMTYGGEERGYLLYLSEQYTGVASVPLVIDLHSDLGTKENQYNTSRFHLVAESENFVLVTPQSLVAGGRQRWNYNNDPSAANDVGFINALMDLVIQNYNIDEDKIYVAGSSGGAVMALNLVCQMDERIAAIAAVKGTFNEAVFSACSPSRPIPVLQLHGTEDTIIPYDPAVPNTLSYWIMHNQTSRDPIVTPVADEFPDNGNTADYIVLEGGTNGVTVEHFRVNGGTHAWFKKPNHDVDATEEAWKFFTKYDLNGRI